ncbi:MAG: alpha-L-fucosidase [Victivallales bacterium]|jgi:hypothetical protein
MVGISWMREGPFGVMVHWTSRIMPQSGTPEPDWNTRVDSFPVEEFADTLLRVGAKWLIFTCGHCGDAFCAPNSAIERYFPGHCSSRDLIAELGSALHCRGLKLIVYFQTEIDHESEAMRIAFGWDLDPRDKTVFQCRWMEVLRAYSEQWGFLVDGWWFDSCYDSKEKTFLRTHGAGWDNSRFNVSEWFGAARAGNALVLVAMNSGVAKDRHTCVFPEFEDYLAGESNDLSIRPGNTELQDGKQWHGLVWLDCFWGHFEKSGIIEPPRYSDDQLLDYLGECKRHKGAVTFNIGIYEDGTLAEATMAQLERLGRTLKKI